jgi:hypothetical protein
MKSTFLTPIFVFGLILFIPAMPSFAKQACVRIQNGKLICGELEDRKNDGNSKPSNKKVATQSKMGLDFTLEGCKKDKAGLYCSISIYNSTDFDKQLAWDFNIKNGFLIDSESRQYKTAIVKMGNVRYHENAILPPKATVTAQIFFKPSNGLSNYIRVLTIAPNIEGNNDVRMTFRDFDVR